MAKTWREKLEATNQKAHISIIDKPFGGVPIGGRLYIAHPMIVKAYIDAIPSGQRRSIPRMRDDLALEADADGTCPLTSSIFVRIVAEAALDEMKSGTPIEAISPFWRVLDEKSPMLKKLSCGPEFVIEQWKREGLN